MFPSGPVENSQISSAEGTCSMVTVVRKHYTLCNGMIIPENAYVDIMKEISLTMQQILVCILSSESS